MSMLMRHMNSIAETLIEEPEAFEPMYLEHVWKGKAVVVPDGRRHFAMDARAPAEILGKR